MQKICINLIIAISWLVLTGCEKGGIASREADERGSSLYRRAFAAEQSGNIEEAIRLFNRVLVDEPRAFSAHFQLATLLHDHASDYISAIYHYKQYLALRPDSEKSELAKSRLRVAEQLLAPQLLRKVGDSVQGLSAAHLLKQNDELNHQIAQLEGERAAFAEERAKLVAETEKLSKDNERLRGIITKFRSGDESVPRSTSGSLRSMVAEESQDVGTRVSSESLRAMRNEATAISKSAPARRTPLAQEVPAKTDDDDLMQRVKNRLRKTTPVAESRPAPPPRQGVSVPAQSEKPDVSSAYSVFVKESKRDALLKKGAERGSARTHVVQPGETLMGIAERYYSDRTKWKRIRDANRTTIDPDGRIRAGQSIIVP